MARAGELSLAGSGRGFLILAAVAGLIAAVLVFIAISSAGSDSTSSSPPSETTTPVVVAASNLAVGTAITADMVKVIQVPNNLVLAGVFTETTPLVGQVTNVPIAAGQQLLPEQVGAKVKGEGLGYVIPNGMRAVGLGIGDTTAVGGLLLPGDHVDILATFTADGSVQVVTVLQNIEILSVEQEALEPVPVGGSTGADQTQSTSASGKVPDEVETHPGGNTAVLLVNPSQAQLLIGLQEKASQIWLIQRSAGDQAPSNVTPSDIGALVPQSQQPSQ